MGMSQYRKPRNPTITILHQLRQLCQPKSSLLIPSPFMFRHPMRPMPQLLHLSRLPRLSQSPRLPRQRCTLLLRSTDLLHPRLSPGILPSNHHPMSLRLCLRVALLANVLRTSGISLLLRIRHTILHHRQPSSTQHLILPLVSLRPLNISSKRPLLLLSHKAWYAMGHMLMYLKQSRISTRSLLSFLGRNNSVQPLAVSSLFPTLHLLDYRSLTKPRNHSSLWSNRPPRKPLLPHIGALQLHAHRLQ